MLSTCSGASVCFGPTRQFFAINLGVVPHIDGERLFKEEQLRDVRGRRFALPGFDDFRFYTTGAFLPQQFYNKRWALRSRHNPDQSCACFDAEFRAQEFLKDGFAADAVKRPSIL